MRQPDDPQKPGSFRHPAVTDAAAVWRISRDSGLDLNAPYAYLLLCRDFADTCLVAEGDDGTILGFVTGYRPPRRPDVMFVWQVAVHEHARRRGLGAALVDELVTRTSRTGVRFLEATVTPSNDASMRLFASIAERRATTLTKDTLFDAELFPDRDHEDEFLLRIGPFTAVARAPNVDA